MTNKSISAVEAFFTADDVLRAGVQGISELIIIPGLINLDFADVKSVMQNAGSALMGIGTAKGEDRAIRASEIAVSSPLLEASIEGAHGVLLLIQGASDIGLHEIDEAARMVQEAVNPEANIIFGANIDDTLGDEVRITVIAAGFDTEGLPKKDYSREVGAAALASVGAEIMNEPEMEASEEADQDIDLEPVSLEIDEPEFEEQAEPEKEKVSSKRDDSWGDDLDIPDFLS
jgi:cell division protein FtsZ